LGEEEIMANPEWDNYKETKPKFKVGDTVKFIRNTTDYSAEEGALARIRGIDPSTVKLPESVTGGLNMDKGKLRVDLVPVSAIRAIAEVLGKATESGKYPPRNWEKGISYSRVYANVMRHMIDWYEGSNKDYESGLNPLKHALCRIAMLVEYEEKKLSQFDDRPKK
jgi:hypothetical protein